jgi:hypothetical protein
MKVPALFKEEASVYTYNDKKYLDTQKFQLKN